MKVRDLIEKLQQEDQGMEVAVLVGLNGHGFPKELNYGPVLRQVKNDDLPNSFEYEDDVGKLLVVVGYGNFPA